MPLQSLDEYLADRCIRMQHCWIEEQEAGKKPNEEVFQELLQTDWNRMKQFFKGSLPKNLNSHLMNVDPIMFPDSLLLQINSIVDIGKPLIMNKISEVIGKKNEEETKKYNKVAPKMLKFVLTDGLQECLAVEYENLGFINETMIGMKLFIKGPIYFFFGLIFLKRSNTEIVNQKTDLLLAKRWHQFDFKKDVEKKNVESGDGLENDLINDLLEEEMDLV